VKFVNVINGGSGAVDLVCGFLCGSGCVVFCETFGGDGNWIAAAVSTTASTVADQFMASLL